MDIFYTKIYIMKNRTVFIFLFLAVFYTMKAQEVVVANAGLNIVYRHVDNPIRVSITGVNPDNVWLTAENAEIQKIGGVDYSLLVTKNVMQISLKINKLENKDTIIIGSYIFKVLPISPYLDFIIFGKSAKDYFLFEMTKAELKNYNALFVLLDDNFFFGVETKFTIKKFNIAFGKEKNAFYTTVNGNKIPEGVMDKILNDLGEGDEIKISNIEVKDYGDLGGIYTVKIK